MYETFGDQAQQGWMPRRPRDVLMPHMGSAPDSGFLAMLGKLVPKDATTASAFSGALGLGGNLALGPYGFLLSALPYLGLAARDVLGRGHA